MSEITGEVKQVQRGTEKWLENYTIKTKVFQMVINTAININKVPVSPYSEIEVKMKYVCNRCDESI